MQDIVVYNCLHRVGEDKERQPSLPALEYGSIIGGLYKGYCLRTLHLTETR